MNPGLDRLRQWLPWVIGVLFGLGVAGLLLPAVFGESPWSSDDDEEIRAAAAPSASDEPESATETPEIGAPAVDQAGPAPRTSSGARRRGTAGSAGGASAAPSAVAAPSPAGDAVKVGILLLDTGGLGRFGIAAPGIDPNQQRIAWQVFIDGINARGGLGGRKFVPVFQTYDVLSQDDMRAACLALTVDAKVFAVMDAGGFFGPPVLCITEEHATPFFSSGSYQMPKEWYPRSRGRLFTVGQGGERLMANTAWLLDRYGHVKEKKIGIVGSARPGIEATVDVLVSTFQRLGHSVVHRADLHADQATSSSQIPVEVSTMRSKGVEVVVIINGTLTATQVVQESESQLWYPRFVTTDWESGSSDVYTQNMPASFEGSISITSFRHGEYRVGVPEPAFDASCRAEYERRTKEALARGSNQHSLTMSACNLANAFERAVAGTGTSLTRERWSQAMQALGTVPLANLGGGGFGPGKFDAADLVRTLRWEAGCKCWKPHTPFARARY